jgi:hypothetical protein
MHFPFRENHHHAQPRSGRARRPGVEKSAKSAPTHVSGPPRGKESVVCRLNDRWRVIACRRSQIQWILQRRGGGAWSDQYYFRTRDALTAYAAHHAGGIDPNAWVTLLQLPDRFPEAQP